MACGHNPCNTNALIAMRSAPRVPAERWMAMTRLDQNRAVAQLAERAGVAPTAVSQMGIWGNHSPTMVPDFENALIDGRPVPEVIPDRAWLENDFVRKVQQRGKEVIDARGKSSAASAANAVVDHLRSMVQPDPEAWFSAAVHGRQPMACRAVFALPLRDQGQELRVGARP